MTPSDRGALRDCMAELQAWERRIDARLAEPQAVVDACLEELLASCAEHAGRVFVADPDGVAVGYVAVLARVPNLETDEIDYDYAQVLDLAVREGWRGRGIGRALLAQAERFAGARGARWLRINVLAGNPRAWALYRECGFSEREIVLEKPL